MFNMHGVMEYIHHIEAILGRGMDYINHAMVMLMVTGGGWFSKLSENTRNFIAVATLIGLGFTAGAVFVGFTTLPDKVAANTARSAEIAVSLEQLRDQVDDFDRDISYLVELSRWTMCAIRVHDEESAKNELLQICGPEPVVRY